MKWCRFRSFLQASTTLRRARVLLQAVNLCPSLGMYAQALWRLQLESNTRLSGFHLYERAPKLSLQWAAERHCSIGFVHSKYWYQFHSSHLCARREMMSNVFPSVLWFENRMFIAICNSPANFVMGAVNLLCFPNRRMVSKWKFLAVNVCLFIFSNKISERCTQSS